VILSEIMHQAFPAVFAEDVSFILARLLPAPVSTSTDPILSFTMAGEALSLPARMYFPEWDGWQRLSAQQQLIYHCMFTRHHNGYVRERAMSHIIHKIEIWTVPFVIQLAGEYVVEIIARMDQVVREEDGRMFGKFLKENPSVISLTRQRALSYWDTYYRTAFFQRSEYPGLRFVARLEAWRNRALELPELGMDKG
jgi:hypothetical protein